MSEENTFRGFNLFYDIDNVDLRSWNRCMMYFNIFQDFGKQMADEYVAALDDISRAQMQKTLDQIKSEGFGNVQQKIRDLA